MWYSKTLPLSLLFTPIFIDFLLLLFLLPLSPSFKISFSKSRVYVCRMFIELSQQRYRTVRQSAALRRAIRCNLSYDAHDLDARARWCKGQVDNPMTKTVGNSKAKPYQGKIAVSVEFVICWVRQIYIYLESVRERGAQLSVCKTAVVSCGYRRLRELVCSKIYCAAPSKRWNELE